MGVGERVGTGDRMGAWTEVEAGEGVECDYRWRGFWRKIQQDWMKSMRMIDGDGGEFTARDDRGGER